MQLIGMIGRKRAGKDTFFGYVQASARPRTVLRLAFADGVKAELAAACGVTAAFVEEHKEEFRLGLQWWGTDFRRRFRGDQYWVDQVRQAVEAERLWRPAALVVLTDVRFPNEVALVREQGGMLVRIVRPQSETADTHPSEAMMAELPQDLTVLNDGCLAALAETARRFVAEYVVQRATET